MLKIRRPLGRLIFNMVIAIPGKTVFLIEMAPWVLSRFETDTGWYSIIRERPSEVANSCLSELWHSVQWPEIIATNGYLHWWLQRQSQDMHPRNLEVEAIDNHGNWFLVKNVNTSGIKTYKETNFLQCPCIIISYAFDFTLSSPYKIIDCTWFQCW